MSTFFACLATAYVCLILGYLIGVWSGLRWLEREMRRSRLHGPLLSLAVLLGLFFGHPMQVKAGEQGRGDAHSASSWQVELLAGIAEVEGWQGRVGPAGEMGPWQMLPRVWVSYAGTAEQRAVKHLRYLEKELLQAGVDPQPFNLALAWNAGLAAVLRGRAPARAYDYARRVCNRIEASRR